MGTGPLNAATTVWTERADQKLERKQICKRPLTSLSVTHSHSLSLSNHFITISSPSGIYKCGRSVAESGAFTMTVSTSSSRRKANQTRFRTDRVSSSHVLRVLFVIISLKTEIAR